MEKNYPIQVENNSQPYPVNVLIQRPEKSSRLLALAFIFLFIPKAIITIPHMVILYGLGIASFVITIIAQFAVLFTGKYPRDIYDFNVNVIRWQVRVNSFMFGLTDKYPPFRLK